MKAYYQVAITKEPVGSAIRHKEPHLEGTPVIKVMDVTTAGENKLIVMDCSEQEHQFNLARPGVMELNEADANKLAAKYQPEREAIEIQSLSRKQEKIKIPAFDLAGFLRPRAGVSKSTKPPVAKAAVKKRKTQTSAKPAAK